jgi:hypothetical protein
MGAEALGAYMAGVTVSGVYFGQYFKIMQVELGIMQKNLLKQE